MSEPRPLTLATRMFAAVAGEAFRVHVGKRFGAAQYAGVVVVVAEYPGDEADDLLELVRIRWQGQVDTPNGKEPDDGSN